MNTTKIENLSTLATDEMLNTNGGFAWEPVGLLVGWCCFAWSFCYQMGVD